MINVADFDLRRENHRLRRELAEKTAELADAVEVIDDLLRAPYLGMKDWADSTACHYREHPNKRTLAFPRGDAPEWVPDECFCRKGVRPS